MLCPSPSLSLSYMCLTLSWPFHSPHPTRRGWFPDSGLSLFCREPPFLQSAVTVQTHPPSGGQHVHPQSRTVPRWWSSNEAPFVLVLSVRCMNQCAPSFPGQRAGPASCPHSLPALKGSDRPAFLSVIPFPSLTKKAFIPMSCLWILLVPARQSGAEMYLCHACAQGH